MPFVTEPGSDPKPAELLVSRKSPEGSPNWSWLKKLVNTTWNSAQPFGDLEVLLHAQVDVPVRHAAVDTEAAVAGVVAEDRLTDIVECRRWIREHVGATQAAGANSVSR